MGFLFAAAIGLAVVFLYLISGANPFTKSLRVHVDYEFAGGIEKGSPVRVAGIKAGQVEKIQFLPASKSSAAVRVTLSISNAAAEHVKSDSRYYINMASAMGDRYVDIAPGTPAAARLESNAIVRGEDPPRIDQFLSQGLNLAGKLTDIFERNEVDLRKMVQTFSHLSSNDLRLLVSNLKDITADVKTLTAKTRSPQSEHALGLMYDLLLRLEPLDKEAVETFFQKKGVKTKIF